MPRRRKKEKYIDKWRKQHKEIRFFFKKEDYEALDKLASAHNMTVKDFILKFINDVNIAVKKGHEEGYAQAVEDFIHNTDGFRDKVRKVYKGDIALFEAPCSICGKPMVFTHNDNNWKSKVKPELMRAFKNWYHVACKKQSLKS